MRLQVVILLTACAFLSTAAPLLSQEAIQGFDTITLGITPAALESLLDGSESFDYQKQEVSLIPNNEQTLITVPGSNYISTGLFQFSDDRLIAITLHLDSKKVGYYTLFSNLAEKYGQTDTFTPQRVTWEDGPVTLSLERPAIIKYLDSAFFDSELATLQERQITEETQREIFLQKF